ncbi:HOP2ous-pairing protein 2 [Candida maltosa Xu316]
MPPIKKNQISQEDAKEVVQLYMKEQYRPYSTNDIQLNMHNILTKAKLTNVLDALVAEKELICKTIGKTNYYVYKQITTNENDTPSEENTMELQLNVKALNQEISELKSKIQETSSTLTNEELESAISDYTTKLENLNNELKQQQQNQTSTVDPIVMTKYVTELKKIKKQRKTLWHSTYSTTRLSY